MSDTLMSSVPGTPENAPATQGSNAAAAGLMVVGVAVMAGTYYAVRRGIDRRIVKKIKEHLDKKEK